MKQIYLLIIILIFVLASVLRLYKILDNPPHLYWDEVSIAYNAYSINQTGKDEWGVSYPLLFKSFGDNKLPLYIYLVAVFQKVIGATDYSVRLPSALSGVVTTMVMFFLVKELSLLAKFKNATQLALLASLFLAIAPWHLQFSRAGFEANVAFMFDAAGITLFLLAMRTNFRLLYLSAVFFVAAMYTYHSAALTTPLILLVLAILFFQKLLSNWHKLLPVILLGLVLILPYVPNYLLSASGRIRFNAESVTNMPGNPVTNTINNYISNLSLDFLFFKGDQNGRHSVKTLGELYIWQLPTILAGLYLFLRRRSKSTTLIVILLLLSILPPALTRVSPHALRSLFAVGPWQVISAAGLLFLLTKLPKWARWAVPAIVTFSLLLYLHIYYVHYPKAFAPDWQDGQRQALNYIIRIQDKYDRIFVSVNDLEAIYILWYTKFNPNTLQANNHDLSQIGKYEFTDLSRIIPKIKPNEKDLMIIPSWMGVYPTPKPLQEITMTYGKPIFRIYEY